MIFYIVTAAHRYTMRLFLETWGRGLENLIKLVFYENYGPVVEEPDGAYIFSDLDRLSPRRRAEAVGVWERLSAAGSRTRVLNHPGRALSRYALLQALRRQGINDFHAYRLSELHALPRLPVFLRSDEHTGSLTPLLTTPQELEAGIARVLAWGFNAHDLLAVEFVDTSDGVGIFRKYAAFVIGDRILPRHLIFSRDWGLKKADLIDDAKLEEEFNYLETNPHERLIRDVCELAGIQYGRIDYGVKEGRPQIWEINTNPMVMLPPSRYRRQNLPTQHWFASRIHPAFDALARGAAPAGGARAQPARSLRPAIHP